MAPKCSPWRAWPQGGELHPVQEGFMQEHGLQCGFCTPGMLIRAYRLLQENPNPTEEEIRYGMAGNLCRCTGYQNIIKAVQYAAEKHAIQDRRRPEGTTNMATPASELEREDKIQGVGCSRKRKEDPRFIQGKGNYVDDVKLPGMLYMDAVRSPYAHARIKSINKERALALPGVHAVLTADDLKPLKLHWMPTLAGDVQAVLADEKVHFQMQEVAVVVADDRYIAADATELVEVEYEELPVLVDPHKAMDPDAPVLREDLAGKTEGAHSKRTHHNHIFTWDVGDKAGTDRVFETAPRHRQASICPTRGCTPARWRPAAAWRASTRSRAT